MNKPSWIVVFLVLLTLACNLPALIEGDEQPAGESGTVSTPQESTLSDPLLVDEEIQCSYFVSPDGDDTNPGSEDQPWSTFEFGLTSSQPGDTVCFREGVYTVEDTVLVTNSGAPGNPIVYAAYPGERPVLDGGGKVGDLFILQQGVSFLRISGIRFQNYNYWGVSLDGDNTNIYLDHLTVDGGEAGVHFTYGSDEYGPPEGGSVDHITLEDSLIINSEYTGVDCTPGPCTNMVFRNLEIYGHGMGGEGSWGADGLAIARGYPVLVEDCYVHDNGGDGIDLNSRDIEGYAEGVIVRRNRVVRNYQNGIKLWAGGRMENNLVWGQGLSAVWIGTFHSVLEVINNTIAYNCWDPSFSERSWSFSVGYPEEIVALPRVDLLLVNNIFAFNTGPELGDPTGIYLGPGVTITEHHNLYYSWIDEEVTAEFLDREFSGQDLIDGTWTDLTGQGEGNLSIDPFFVSGWPDVNLALQHSSPAIDMGDNSSCPTSDSAGKPRSADSDDVCDIGAVEFQP